MGRYVVKKIVPVLMVFVLIMVLVVVERRGVKVTNEDNISKKRFYTNLSDADKDYTKEVSVKKDCLLIVDTLHTEYSVYSNDMKDIFREMKVEYDIYDPNKERMPDLSAYKKIVFSGKQLNIVANNINKIIDWVNKGGNFFFTTSLIPDNTFFVISSKIGIKEFTRDTKYIKDIKVIDDELINDGRILKYDEDTVIAAMGVTLDDSADVVLSSEDEKLKILWKYHYGDGKFVVLNSDAFGKSIRGFLCAGYSMLDDYFAYPVINSSTYYIDDYPVPVPTTKNEYIEKFYDMDIETFYNTVWIKDVLAWENEYGILHTGVLVENYGKDVTAPFKTEDETLEYSYLGNMLINNGGQIGLHGYNHMPLVFENFDFKGEFDSYIPWKKEEDMSEALLNLSSFAKNLFPNEEFSVYIPPSNILSDEGRKVLVKTLPNIKMISKSYMGLNCVEGQEYGIGADGIVDAPRLLASCDVSNSDYVLTFSELNYHYVQSHFIHPDDALDPERGAKEGWEKMEKKFREYLDYVADSAPDIRNMVGSDSSEAVKRFAKLNIGSSVKDGNLEFDLGGFYDEAFFMLRINNDDIIGGDVADCDIEGADIKKVANHLYLVHATSDKIVISGGK